MLITYKEFDNKMRVSSFVQDDQKETYEYEMISERDDVKSFAVSYELLNGEVVDHYRNEYEDVYVGNRYSYTKNRKKYRDDYLVMEPAESSQAEMARRWLGQGR